MAKLLITSEGYALQDGNVTTPITTIVDGGKTLKLPTNSSNRQYFSIERLTKSAINGELELTYKPSVTITKTSDSAPRTIKPLEDWLEGEDKATYLALKQKAQEARDEANTKAPMTELEKKRKAVERAQKALEELEKSMAPAQAPVAPDQAPTESEKGAE